MSNSIFKVGYSADVESRLAALNSGLISSVTGYSWGLALLQGFPREQQAYNFEQIMYSRLIE